MGRKINIVTGCNGQIGSYLCEYLVANGEETVGVVRRSSVNNTERLDGVLSHNLFQLRCADVTDPFSLIKLFNEIIVDKKKEYVIYNLAAMSFVKASFSQPIVSSEITGIGHLNILEALLSFHRLGFNIKTFFMNSSEIMGNNVNSSGFQNMNIQFAPNSPYGVAKLYAYHMNRIYRESYGMFNTAGIIFNSESPRRGEEFVTKKISQWFARFLYNGFDLDKVGKLRLGNLLACRDWTHAKDTVKAIYSIANNVLPKDYVVASGETHTIRDFLVECYKLCEEMVLTECFYKLDDLYEIDEQFFRPNEVKYLRGDSSAIRHDLGWKPTYSFKDIVADMLKSDYQQLLDENSKVRHEVKIKS